MSAADTTSNIAHVIQEPSRELTKFLSSILKAFAQPGVIAF